MTANDEITALLIEDNPADARMIREVLKEEPSTRFKVEQSDRLDTGLERLAKGGIDVILLDLALPDSQGIDTFLQTYTHSPGVPIVVLTGLNDQLVAAQTLQAGGQDYLNKGALNLCILHQSIRNAIERKHAEEIARRSDEAIEAVTRAQDQFLAMVTEELSMPLTPLLSIVSTQVDELSPTADLLRTLTLVRNHVGRQAQLVGDLQAYCRVGAGNVGFRSTDCEAVLEHALAELKRAIEDTRAVVTHDPLPTLPADASLIDRLFQNLIENAIKFRGTAAPRIHVSAERRDREWIFTVRDNGIGFDPKDAERIFVIFQRLHDRDVYPGTGIGLATCKKIVERHGGRIWAESEPGRGSRFCFSVPAERDGSCR